jgi:hypothetical protein
MVRHTGAIDVGSRNEDLPPDLLDLEPSEVRKEQEVPEATATGARMQADPRGQSSPPLPFGLGQVETPLLMLFATGSSVLATKRDEPSRSDDLPGEVISVLFEARQKTALSMRHRLKGREKHTVLIELINPRGKDVGHAHRGDYAVKRCRPLVASRTIRRNDSSVPDARPSQAATRTARNVRLELDTDHAARRTDQVRH